MANSGIKIVIGPVFNESLIYLDELSELTFLALTNKNDNFSKNIINAGINATSQLNAIKKFIELNEIKKTIFLTPDVGFKNEIEKAISNSKIKILDNFSKNIINAGINATSQLNAIKKFIELNEIKKTIFLTPDVGFKNEIEKAISNSKIKILENYIYNTDPTKLTKQIEKITRYEIRKQNLEDEINRLEKSEQSNKELLIERLKKRDTLGSVKFDSVVISDFDESLKSVTTSLLYTDITPKEKYFITLNQWFDESLLKETSSQPLYFPSANKDNYDEFSNEYFEKYNQYPNQLSFLSYDLVGLVYYLILQNESVIDKKMFTKKTLFKGKVGVFEIKNNKINHILNFYKAEDGEFKKVF